MTTMLLDRHLQQSYWTRRSTLQLIKSMNDFKFLWKPKIYRERQYRPAIKTAMKYLMRINKRPWREITSRLSCLRSKFRKMEKLPLQERKWVYFDEMSRHFKPEKETEVHL